MLRQGPLYGQSHLKFRNGHLLKEPRDYGNRFKSFPVPRRLLTNRCYLGQQAAPPAGERLALARLFCVEISEVGGLSASNAQDDE